MPRTILDDEILAVEFYLDGKRRFGGDIPRSDPGAINAAHLAKYFGYTAEFLSQFDFEVYSWSGKHDIALRRCE